jgi:hypothetical protein
MRRLLLSAFALAVSTQTAVRGSTILSENFDALTALTAVTTVGANFVTINGTNVDIVGPGNGFGALCVSPAANNCVDLNGSGGNPQGQLQSTTLFGPGSYLLSFDLIGSGRGTTASATVTFGNYNQTFSLLSGDTTTGIIVNQAVTVGAGGSHLLFASGLGGNVGLVLDNVVIATADSTVPEPSSFLMLASAFGLVAIAVIRRRLS